MAMVYDAREILKDGKPTGLFHFTAGSDEERGCVYPVGLCAQGCPGHATKEAAYEHYTQWRVDLIKLDGRDQEHQSKCRVCAAWTDRFAYVDHRPFGEEWPLCDEHRTHAQAERLLRGKA
jgi:hypothetical protein